jgi:lipopolysaccharide export system protein LptA
VRRKVILLVVSFLVLLAAFGIYLTLAGGGRGGRAYRRALRELSELSRQAPRNDSQAMKPWKGTEFRALDRDKDGRLKASYFAPDWERQDDGSYLLIKPSAVLYQPGGQQIRVDGQRGIVYVSTDEAYREDQIGSSRFRIYRGRLEGAVTVLYDRATTAERLPADQRPQDVMRITTEDIEINNEELMLFTNSRVTVVSSEADIAGEGLSIRWNEDPEELRVLRLEHGDYMKVYYVREDEGLLALPGGVAAIAPTEPPALAESAIAVPTAAPATQRGSATRPSETPKATTTVVASAPQPEGPSGGRLGADRRRAQNIYRATFDGDVTVNQGARYIHGADTLSLDFQWESSWEDRQGDKRQRQSATAAAPKTGRGQAAPPAAQPASGPGGAQPTIAPATRSARGEPVLVKWNGPLVITPAGYTDAPSRKNVATSGQGRRVVLSDSRATATCRKFSFRRPAEQGELSGQRDDPVVLTTANGENMVCPVVRFDLQGGTAELAGAGYMTRPAEVAPSGSPTPPESPTTRPVDRIKWDQSVDIRLASDAAGARSGAEAGGQYVKEATFRGNVELVQAGSGDYLRCRELAVSLGREGRTQFIEKAVAAGGVRGRQEDQGISADRLTVNFAPTERPRQGAYGRAVAKDMLAEGNVRVTGKQDAWDWLASADRLEADRPTRTAALYGKPAWINRGQESISGPEIRLAEEEGTAKVVGQGRMTLLADRNLSGQKLSTPRPVEVSWTRQMDYSDRLDLAIFDGNVGLVSGLERMECDRQMRVYFQKQASHTAESGAAAKVARSGDSTAQAEKPAGVLTLGARSYGGRLSRIYADDEVVLKSLRQDKEDRLLGKAELKGKGLVYDAIGKRMDIGRGILFVQDFRSPKPPKAAAERQQPIGGEVESPSQTYFEWARSMRLVMDERMVTMAGDVWMRHYGGDKIVNRAAMERDLKLPPWPQQLPSGRASDLLCDNLVARFAKPPEKQPSASTPPATQPEEDLETGLRLVGAMDVFVATGSVLLVDGLYEVTGERLSYDRSTDIVLVRGYLEGQTPALATVTTRDPPSTTESEWIKWYRRTNAWETGRISGAGARVGSPRK